MEWWVQERSATDWICRRKLMQRHHRHENPRPRLFWISFCCTNVQMWVDVVQLRGYGNDSNRVDKKGLLLTGQSFAIAICHFVPGPDLASMTTTSHVRVRQKEFVTRQLRGKLDDDRILFFLKIRCCFVGFSYSSVQYGQRRRRPFGSFRAARLINVSKDDNWKEEDEEVLETLRYTSMMPRATRLPA
jgi:hypothetical protein